MAGIATLAARHYRERLTLVKAVDAAAKRIWRTLDPHALRATWTVASFALLAIVTRTQQAAAASATPYVSSILAEQGIQTASVVNAFTFAGVASDGRALESLLEQPLIQTLTAIREGVPLQQALLVGETSLRMIVGTQVADAGRVADGVAITGSHTVGYVRMLNPPSCSRCAILAGKWYRWNAGFQRHPLCDCIAIPAAESIAGDLLTSPKAYFDSLSETEQNKTFTKAGAEAVRDGADLSRVVNARRGIYTAGGRKLTHEAAGRRVRLMPEQIYRDANGSREEALRLLKRFGYLL